MPIARVWFAGAIVAFALVITTGAAADSSGSAAIEPGTRVNGMLVVRGLARDADYSIFEPFCDPVVVKPGWETRDCAMLPRSARLFIGHGTWAVSRKQLEQAWREESWALWIDGRPVRLTGFGTTDRWIPHMAEANGRRVLLREWSVVLAGAQGRHSIRYSWDVPPRLHSATWEFTVASR